MIRRGILVSIVLLLVPAAHALQSTPRMASDGTNHMLTWVEQREGSATQMIMPLDANGTARDIPSVLGPALRVSAESQGNSEISAASIAFGRSVYLTVWREPSRIVGRRVDRDGRVLDQQPLVISDTVLRDYYGPGVSDQAIAWDGQHFFVVWQSDEGLFTTLVDEAGTLSTRRNPLPPRVYLSAKVVWSGRNFIMTWHRIVFAQHWFMPGGFFFARVSKEGVALDKMLPSWAEESSLPQINIDSFFGWNSPIWHLASSGKDTWVVVDKPGSLGEASVIAVPVLEDEHGLRLGARVPLFRWFGETVSDVVWDDKTFVVAWRYSSAHWEESASWWTMTARFDSQGRVFDPGVVRTGRSAVLTVPTVAGGNARVLVQAEIVDGSSERQLRLRAEREFHAPAAVPAAPVVRLVVKDSLRVVQWEQATGDVNGFVIEAVDLPGRWFIGAVGPDKRLFYVGGIPSVRMYAFNESGMSEPSNLAYLSTGSRGRTIR